MLISLYLFESVAEPLEHSLHVASLLHGDDSGVVLLIHPDQEGLLIVVPEENQPKELNKRALQMKNTPFISGDDSCS